MELEKLTQEINLIVSAPYVVSLKGLYDIVCKGNLSHTAIQAWTAAKPCQVNAIALTLLEGLQEWPLTLEILTSFLSAETFRNTLLQIRPTVLDELLEKSLKTPDANENDPRLENAFQDKYFEACVVMLSAPLPETVITPRRFSAFILALIEHVARKPCVETIRPLHRVMAGISGSFLELLPEATLSRFQTECTRVLRNMDDHLGSLLCLATFAKIASSGASSSTAGSAWFMSVRQFFDQTRGMKTLDLAVLRAILSCSTSSNLSFDERVQCIALARVVCDAVEPGQKEAWISNNRPKFMKLCEKILKPELDDEIQMMGLIHLTALLPPNMLPSEIVHLAHGKLVNEECWRCFDKVPEKEIAFLAGRVSQRLSQKELTDVFSILVSTMTEGKETGRVLVKRTVTQSIVSGLMTAFKEAPSMLAALSAVFSDSSLLDLYTEESLSDIRVDHRDCRTTGLCPSASAAMRNRILIDLASLGLEVLPLSTPGTATSLQQSRIASYLSALLARSRKLLTSAENNGSNSHRPPQTRFNIFDSSQVSRIPVDSRNWRGEISRTLAGHAEQTHEIIIRQMGEICRDFEARCDTVEEPLRSVTADLDNLKADYEACKADRDSLVSREGDMKATISALEDENEQLEKRAESAENHAEDLLSRLCSAKDEIKNNKQTTQGAIKHAEENARDAELKFLAMLTAKDDTIEEQQDDIDGLKKKLDELKAQIQEVSNRERAYEDRAETLQTNIASLENNLQVEKDVCSGQEAELRKLRAHNDSLRSEIESAKTQLSQNAEEIDGLRVEMQQQKEMHSRIVEDLRQQREADQATEKIEVDTHKENIDRLQASLRTHKQRSAQESLSMRKHIRALEKELKQLREDNAAKSHELAKARENRDKLMEVLGDFGKTVQEKVISRSPPKTSRKSGFPPSNQENSRWHKDDDVQLLVTDSFGSSGSTASGPTPKRPKSSRGIQTPSFEQRTSAATEHSGDAGGGGSSTTTRRRTKSSAYHPTTTERRRQPLCEAKGNGSPSKQGRKSILRVSDTQETASFATQPEMDMGGQIGDLTADYLDEDIFLSPGTV